MWKSPELRETEEVSRRVSFFSRGAAGVRKTFSLACAVEWCLCAKGTRWTVVSVCKLSVSRQWLHKQTERLPPSEQREVFPVLRHSFTLTRALLRYCNNSRIYHPETGLNMKRQSRLLYRNSDLFIAILRYELAIASYKVWWLGKRLIHSHNCEFILQIWLNFSELLVFRLTILTLYLAIASLYHTILRKNCESK